MPKIDRTPGESSPPEWRVCVAVSVFELVPRDLLAGWIAVETFARTSRTCWPGNAALAARLSMRSIPAVQDLLLRLEDHQIIERRDLGGNRREIVLRRRTADPLAVSEWAAIVAQADQTRAARADAPKKPDRVPSVEGAQVPSVEGAKRRSRITNKTQQLPRVPAFGKGGREL